MEGRRLRLRFILLGFVCLAGASVAIGQDFWSKKPFNGWTDEELKKFMSDSPWAKNQTMATAPPGSSGLDMGSGGGGGGGEEEPGGAGAISGGGGGGGRGGGGGGGRGGGGDFGGGRGGRTAAMTLVMSWQSALPIKQANVRSLMTQPGEVPADSKTYLDSSD